MVLDYLNASADDKRLVTGTPVQVEWGYPGRSRVFYGYTNHLSRNNSPYPPGDADAQAGLRLYCVGASWWLKGEDYASYPNATVPQVVQAVALGNRMASIVGPNDYVWPFLSQQGQSYWTFLVGLVKRIGYSLISRGVTLVALPRNTNPQLSQNLISSFDYNQGHVLKFSVTSGENAPGEEPLRQRKGYFLDPRSGTVGELVHNGFPKAPMGVEVAYPVFQSMMGGLPASSASEMTQDLVGASESNQLYLGAEAVLVGNARVSAGDLVFFLNIPNGSQNGVWYVKKAIHYLHGINYTTTLVLGRNAYSSTGGVATPYNYSYSPLAGARIVQGRWST